MAKKKKRIEDDEKPKKKSRAVVEDDEDDEDDDRPYTPKKPSGNDAYSGMLVIGLICLIATSVILMLDSNDMTASPLSNPTVTIPALATAPQAAAAN
jgi:hypothetical protein